MTTLAFSFSLPLFPSLSPSLPPIFLLSRANAVNATRQNNIETSCAVGSPLHNHWFATACDIDGLQMLFTLWEASLVQAKPAGDQRGGVHLKE